jgi:hypothetical protein
MFVLACVHTANARGKASPTSLQDKIEAELELDAKMDSNRQLCQERIPECITEHTGRYLPTPTGIIIKILARQARATAALFADEGGEQPRQAEDK